MMLVVVVVVGGGGGGGWVGALVLPPRDVCMWCGCGDEYEGQQLHDCTSLGGRLLTSHTDHHARTAPSSTETPVSKLIDPRP